MINNWETLLTAGVVLIGLALSLLLLFIKREISSRLLALYTLVLAIGMAEPLIHAARLSSRFTAYYGTMSFFYGPMLFLYVKSALAANPKFSGRDLFHFGPALLYFMLVFSSPENGNANDEEDMTVSFVLYELLFYQIFYYTIKSFTLWTRAYSLATNQPMMMRLTFLKYLLIFSAMLFATSFVFVHVFVMARMSPFPPIFYTYIQLGFTLLILTIAFLNTELIYPKRLPA